MRIFNDSKIIGTIAGSSLFLFIVFFIFAYGAKEPDLIAVLLAVLWMGGGTRYFYLKNKQKRAR